MRWIALVFGIVVGAVVIGVAARYGYKTSDNDADGMLAAFIYGSITFGALLFHPLAIRVWRTNKTFGTLIGIVGLLALFIGMSNSLGALAGRGDETTAKLLKTAETVRGLKRSIESSEKERKSLSFTATDLDAVNAAKRNADAATRTREAECRDKRGPKCQDRETDERRALEEFKKATRDKAVTDQAAVLDHKITEDKGKLEKEAPVKDANPQGSVFARILNLPNTAAARLSALQNAAMVVMVDVLIVFSLIAFEILGHTKPEPGIYVERKSIDIIPEEAPQVLEASHTEEPKAFPAPLKPRLIASSHNPMGSVALIMVELMEKAPRGKIEFPEAYRAYAEECNRQGKTPISIEEFAEAIDALCKRLWIEIEADKKGRVFLLNVRLRKPAAEGQAQNAPQA